MKRYRYRTTSLVGPWRNTALEAESDALAAGQADFDESGRRLVWKVDGGIETRDSADGDNGGFGRVN
jgi:hypothetical protein